MLLCMLLMSLALPSHSSGLKLLLVLLLLLLLPPPLLSLLFFFLCLRSFLSLLYLGIVVLLVAIVVTFPNQRWRS